MTTVDPAEKKALRAALRASLREIDPAEAHAAGRAAADALIAWSGFAEASEVAAFASLPDELDTIPFFELIAAAGKTLMLPRVRGAELEFVPVANRETLIRAPYGMLEPGPEGACRPVAPGALVLVPGLAFDSSGGRLGRGAGYYDRALARIRGDSHTTFLGVGFAIQIIERVPMGAHDVRVDGVLTERALFWVDR